MPDATRASGRSDGTGRLRAILLVVVVLLLAGTVVLGVVFVRMLQPAGAPTKAEPDGLVWVKSMYGFGSAKDEQLLEPTSVAIAPNGDVYANDPQRARVMRFASDGTFKSLVHTGAGGTGKGQFIRPGSLATDGDGNLYVADPFANKIIVFDDRDTYLREWATDRPNGVSVHGDAVYVMTNGVVTVFGKGGEPRGSFGRRGRARGEIDAYQGVIGDGSRIYVADALNRRLEAFELNGDVAWVRPDPDASVATATADTTPTAGAEQLYDLPQDLVFDGAGRLVVIDAFRFETVVVDPKDGKVLARYGEYGTNDGQFFYPTGIDYDPARDWFAIADTRNDRVQIVRLPGSGETLPAPARRLMASPWRYCALPLALVALALAAALVGRRRAAAAVSRAETPE
ncbi:MAG TPA: NHL repeat-containing protein [Coriobacteriia bacterium]